MPSSRSGTPPSPESEGTGGRQRRLHLDIGVFLQPPTVDKAVQQFRTAADAGFRSGWMPQAFGIDALSSLAVVGREVAGIDLGRRSCPRTRGTQ